MQYGIKIQDAEYAGISVNSAYLAGYYIGRTDYNGFYADTTGMSGFYSDDALESGFYSYKSNGDAFKSYKVGNPSSYNFDDYNSNGLEIAGAEGHGVYIGQSDKTGVLLNKVGNPSSSFISPYKNAFEVNGAEGNGLRVGYAGHHGIWIEETRFTGMYIKQTGNNGVLINTVGNPSTSISMSSVETAFKVIGTEGYGLYVGRSDRDAIRIYSAGEAGIYIEDSGTDGIFIANAEDDGGTFIGQDKGVVGATDATSHEYGLWTNDKTYSGYGYDGSKMNSFGKNTGSESLEPGDLVIISGGYEEDTLGKESGIPVIHVKKADKDGSNSIFGVVEYKVNIRKEIEELEDGKTRQENSFKRAKSFIANTGDYLSIVILGPTDVKVADRSESIIAGEPLKASSNAGARKIRTTMLNGLEIAENVGIVGKALEDSNGKGMVKVFVNCK